MTELRINGYRRTVSILALLLPYLRFKQVQARAMQRAAVMLCAKKFLRNLSQKERMMLAECILIVQNENYQSRHKKTQDELYSILELVPVTTS